MSSERPISVSNASTFEKASSLPRQVLSGFAYAPKSTPVWGTSFAFKRLKRVAPCVAEEDTAALRRSIAAATGTTGRRRRSTSRCGNRRGRGTRVSPERGREERPSALALGDLAAAALYLRDRGESPR